MKYQLAVFDFDGTLADSFPFFLRSFNLLAERHGFSTIDVSQADQYRHCGAREMMRHVGLPAWRFPLVAKDFIALMREEAHQIPLFQGVDGVLQDLVAAGVKLAIVSSNAHDNICRILGPDNVRRVSHFECGMSVFGKTARIRRLLKNAGVPTQQALYIGDQITDIEAARKARVAFGAVAWGYGSMDSLRQHAPEEEFGCLADIRRIAGAAI
ncbi:MAG: HAD hydrolase-like protein [Rhodocyclaceae bacterium]